MSNLNWFLLEDADKIFGFDREINAWSLWAYISFFILEISALEVLWAFSCLLACDLFLGVVNPWAKTLDFKPEAEII